MNVLDLFSGIGGFSLGLERAGMRTVAFCEIDPFCRKVLAKHWPGVNIYEDIRGLRVNEDVDVICGGFPCQDISVAGKGAGLAGERSGLWSEYARIIGELRPAYVIVENVAALLARGLDRVLGDLAALGYDAEWHCIPASAIGAPHRRDRLWIIAYADGARLQERQLLASLSPEARRDDDGQDAAMGSWWAVEPKMVRVVHGVPGRVDRIRSLGNAVVPQIPEIIGRAIMRATTQEAPVVPPAWVVEQAQRTSRPVDWDNTQTYREKPTDPLQLFPANYRTSIVQGRVVTLVRDAGSALSPADGKTP